MPIYKVDIEKLYVQEYYTNVYHVEAADLQTASINALDIVGAERTIHGQGVNFTKMRVSDITPNSEEFNTEVLGFNGLRGGAGEVLPLWNVARVDFGVFGGRPSRKFLRLPLLESDMGGFGVLDPALITLLDTYGTTILDVPGICDESGNDFNSSSTYPRCAMRQLRRGSKRRQNPIIP